MGIYVKIEGYIAKGYEISMLKELIKKLEQGEKNFTIKFPYAQGEIKVES